MSIEIIAVSLGVAGLALTGLVVGAVLRRNQHETVKSMIARGKPLRPLTSEERIALEPVLAQIGGPHAELVRDGVFALNGPLLPRHLQPRDGAGHDTIGGVSVLLPFDAAQHAGAVNDCEVVLTRKVAIVIGLNDSFDLVDASQREANTLSAELEPSDSRTPALAPAQRKSQVEVVGQRAESAAEVAVRTRHAGGVAMMTLLLSLACSVLASRTLDNWQALWATLSVWLAVAAMWSIWRGVRLDTPGRVNRVRGPLALVGEPGSAERHFHFGDGYFQLRFPPHWRRLLAAHPAQHMAIEVDLRAKDHSVVRLAPALSVHEEVKRHPPVFWVHHLVLALTGLLIGGAVWWWSDRLLLDLQQGWQWAHGEEQRVIESPDALRAAAPGVGRWVHLRGQARCEVPKSAPMTARGCDSLRWGGQPLVWPALAVDEATQLLSDGSYMQSVSQPFVRRSPLGLPAPLSVGQQGVFIRNTPELVQAVEEVCPPKPSPSPACRDLKNELRPSLTVEGEVPRDWDAVLEALANERLDTPRTLDSPHALTLHARAKAAALLSMERAVRTSLDMLALSQQGGVALEREPVGHSSRAARDPMDPIQVWDNHQPEAPLSQPQVLDLQGRVAAISLVDTVPRWIITPREPWSFWRNGLPLVWLAVAAWLLVVHGLLGILQLAAASTRRRALLADTRKRWFALSTNVKALAHTGTSARPDTVSALETETAVEATEKL